MTQMATSSGGPSSEANSGTPESAPVGSIVQSVGGAPAPSSVPALSEAPARDPALTQADDAALASAAAAGGRIITTPAEQARIAEDIARRVPPPLP